MLQDRLFGAFSFRQGVYYDAEHDLGFTRTAWGIVLVTAFLNQLGSYATSDLPRWIAGTIGGTISEVLGFALAAFLVSWIGRNFFNAEVNFSEMVRTLGLAYVWRVIGVVGVLTAILPGLACIVAPVAILALVLGLAAWFFAAREALDLDIVQTVVTVILAFIGQLVVLGIVGVLLSLLGLSSALI